MADRLDYCRDCLSWKPDPYPSNRGWGLCKSAYAYPPFEGSPKRWVGALFPGCGYFERLPSQSESGEA